MKRLTLAGGLIGAFALLVPTAAFGSTASKAGNTITVAAGGGEKNVITVSYSAGANQYTITDTAGITAQAPCVQVNTTTVTCPNGTVTNLVVNAGNQDDSVTLDEATILATLITNLNGEQGKDVLRGANSSDSISGGSQDDSADGRKGADTYSGGPGTDTVSYTGNPVGVTVTVGSGTGDDGNLNDLTGSSLDTVGADNEAVFGTVGNDRILGDGSDEFLFGLGGEDFANGNAGGDKVSGGADNDRVVGGPGDDRVIGKGGTDVLKGQGGIDRLKARDGIRDAKINCGKGRNRFEDAKVDRIDPDDKSC